MTKRNFDAVKEVQELEEYALRTTGQNNSCGLVVKRITSVLRKAYKTGYIAGYEDCYEELEDDLDGG